MSAVNRLIGSRDAFVRTNRIMDSHGPRLCVGLPDVLMPCAFRDRTGVVRAYANCVNNQPPFISWKHRNYC